MSAIDLDAVDRILAEKVMGWGEANPRPMAHSEDYFEPTQNISQAFEVLEKFGSFDIGKYGIRWEAESDNPIDEEYYQVRVLKPGGRNDNPDDSVTVIHATPELAICLAVLKSLGLSPPMRGEG